MDNANVTLKKIKNFKNMPGLIAEALKEDILRGKIQGGVQLKQEEIAKRFDVSFIPIREAIIQLEAQGLVQCIRNKGAIVTELSITEMEQVFKLRSILESGAIRQAIPNMEDEHFNKAEYLIKQMENEKDPYRWSRLNWLFHEVLYTPTQNDKLMGVIENLFVSIQRYTVLLLTVSDNGQRAYNDHLSIIEACKSGNINNAALFVDNHIDTYRNILRSYIKE